MKTKDIHFVVVTGAGSGIGRATALRFAKLGATVACIDVNEQAAFETAHLIAARNGVADAYALDVSDPIAYATLADEIQLRHGAPDVVVNNAGILKVGGTLTHTMEDWDRVVDVDLSGVVYGCQLFGSQMVSRGTGGHIVNISSMAPFAPTVAFPSYTTAKSGVLMLSECLHAELHSDGIGVTAICPGIIHTDLWRTTDLLLVDPDESARRMTGFESVADLARKVRIGSQPDDVARAIVRAIERNQVVVPVGAEAWTVYALSRLAPDLVLLGTRLSRDDVMERVTSLFARKRVVRSEPDRAEAR